MPLATRPLTPTFGLEVLDIDLRTPTNAMTACWNDCFAQSVNGNTTLKIKPMRREDVVAPFLAAFASEDPAKGGCKDLRKKL